MELPPLPWQLRFVRPSDAKGLIPLQTLLVQWKLQSLALRANEQEMHLDFLGRQDAGGRKSICTGLIGMTFQGVDRLDNLLANLFGPSDVPPTGCT